MSFISFLVSRTFENDVKWLLSVLKNKNTLGSGFMAFLTILTKETIKVRFFVTFYDFFKMED